MKIKVNLPSGRIEESIESDRVMVGRSSRCDLTIPDESLSRYHCLIEYKDGNFLLTDVGSANGVYINGEKLQPHVPYNYNPFNSLSIGYFDCFIEEDEIAIPEIPDIPTSKKVEKKIQPADTPRKLKFDNPIIKIAILPFIMILAVVTYYFFEPAEESENNIASSQFQTIKRKKIQAPHNKIPDKFYSQALYVSQDKLRNCDAEVEQFCQKMKLNYETEGFYKTDQELYVYLKPSLYISESRYKGIRDNADLSSMIAFDKILSSSVMDRYFINGNFQVHLILKNDKNKLFKVFRFHPGKYSSHVANRMDALYLLENAIIGLTSSEPFWKHISFYIPEMTIDGDNFD